MTQRRPSIGGALAAMPFAVVTGLLLGVVAVYVAPQVVGFITHAYDEAFPVLEMRGRLVARGEDYVDLHIVGRKLRGAECRYVSIYGYALRPDGLRTDATVRRTDMPETGVVRSAVAWDMGTWRVRPVDAQATRVEVWTHHQCVGRDVLTKISDVEMPR